MNIFKGSPGVFMGCHGWKSHTISDTAPKMVLADKNTLMLLREKLLLGKGKFEIKKLIETEKHRFKSRKANISTLRLNNLPR